MRDDTPEVAFEDTLIELAATQGWMIHCERPAFSSDLEQFTTPIKGHRGYPDVTAVHPFKGMILAELKSRRGRMGPGQREWIRTLARYDTDGDVLVEVWQPSDWPAIQLCLTEGVHAYRALYRKPPTEPTPEPTLGS